jgi:hypothetical protein
MGFVGTAYAQIGDGESPPFVGSKEPIEDSAQIPPIFKGNRGRVSRRTKPFLSPEHLSAHHRPYSRIYIAALNDEETKKGLAHYSIRYSYGTLLPGMLPTLDITKAQAGVIYSSLMRSVVNSG